MALTLGDRIRKARGAVHQKDLAPRIHKGVSTLRNWERGKNVPSDGDLLLTAKETGVRYEWLKRGEEPMRDVGQQPTSVQEAATNRTDTSGSRSVRTFDPEKIFTLIIRTKTSTIRLPVVAVGMPEIEGEPEVPAEGFELE